jgi:hypothetical protein
MTISYREGPDLAYSCRFVSTSQIAWLQRQQVVGLPVQFSLASLHVHY